MTFDKEELERLKKVALAAVSYAAHADYQRREEIAIRAVEKAWERIIALKDANQPQQTEDSLGK